MNVGRRSERLREVLGTSIPETQKRKQGKQLAEDLMNNKDDNIKHLRNLEGRAVPEDDFKQGIVDTLSPSYVLEDGSEVSAHTLFYNCYEFWIIEGKSSLMNIILMYWYGLLVEGVS